MELRKKYPSEYQAWANAKRRCNNIKNPMYKYYGERGIKMSKDWSDSFLSFLNDMGTKPRNNLTLDRTDNNLGYQKGNCRWVDMKTQCGNRRKRDFVRRPSSQKVITSMGVTKTLKEWNECLGYVYNNLFYFKQKKNMTYEEAIEFVYNQKLAEIMKIKPCIISYI